jgi:hypothetical protein
MIKLKSELFLDSCSLKQAVCMRPLWAVRRPPLKVMFRCKILGTKERKKKKMSENFRFAFVRYLAENFVDFFIILETFLGFI